MRGIYLFCQIVCILLYAISMSAGEIANSFLAASIVLFALFMAEK